MSATLIYPNYVPFGITKNYFQAIWQKSPSSQDNWKQVATKLTIVFFMTFIGSPVVFLMDLIVGAAVLASRHWTVVDREPIEPVYVEPISHSEVHKEEIKQASDQVSSATGELLTENQAKAVLEQFNVSNQGDVYFMREAMQAAHKRLSDENKILYAQLLKNYGVYDSSHATITNEKEEVMDREPVVEIFSWIARCCVAYYLLHKHNRRACLVSFLNTNALFELVDVFRGLHLEQKAALILQLQVPETKWLINESATELYRSFEKIASNLIQNKEFNAVYKEAFPMC